MSRMNRVFLLGTVLVVISTGMNLPGWAATQKILYSFANQTDGWGPQGALVMDSAGNLYGTTSFGGAFNNGTVFELQYNQGQWTKVVLHSFAGYPRDGSKPLGNLVFDKVGNLYGTTYLGGTGGSGTVFRLTPSAGGNWTESILYSFGAFVGDAALPGGGLFFDGHGNIFGVTQSGGNGPCGVGGFSGCGAFFELTHSSGRWTETVLYSFAGSPDVAFPSGNLVADSQGNFYGPSLEGGSTNCAEGCGTIYELIPSAGGGWTEQVFYAPEDGFYPVGPLLVDQAGNLYGTSTLSPNFASNGTVFELSPSSSGWTETVIYNFSGAPDGNEPESGLVRDRAGNLYGTTYWGGGGRCIAGQGCGTVFVLEKSSGGWQEHHMGLNGPELPSAGLILDSAGNTYGTSTSGGTDGLGTVFEVSR